MAGLKIYFGGFILLFTLFHLTHGKSNYCTKSYVANRVTYQYSYYTCVRYYTYRYYNRYTCGWRYHYYYYVYYGYNRYYCGWFSNRHYVPIYGTCSRRTVRYVPYTKYYRTCCDGWSGSACDIPVCSGGCPNGGFCTAPGQCTCPAGREGSNCVIAKCPGGSTTFWSDCYPGTCVSNSKCKCYDGFGGDQCLKVLDAPKFKRCSVQLVSPRNDVLFSGKCGPTTKPEDYTYYTNAKHYAEIVFDAESVYQWPTIPRKPSYVRDFDVGNVDSWVYVTMNDDNLVQKERNYFDCDERPNDKDPYQAAECRNKTYPYSISAFNGYSMNVSIYAKTGGYKVRINPDEGELTKYYTGQTEVAAMTIIFDHDAPVHCHTSPNVNCTAEDAPLAVIEYINEGNVTVDMFSGWTDEGTGLAGYTIHVYNLTKNSAGLLDNSGAPVKTLSRNLLDEELDIMTFDLPEPGRYSLEMMTSDRAGNVRMSRALVFYDNTENVTKTENETVAVRNAVLRSGMYWLTSFNENGPTVMEVDWANVFFNQYHVESNFMARVKPKPADWGYEDSFGNLTTDAINHINGITAFQFTYHVDQVGGSSIKDEELVQKLVPVMPFQTETTITHTIRNGYSIVLAVVAYDAVGFGLNATNVVHVDSSPPEVREGTFQKDVNSSDPENVPFASALNVNTFDEESGIDEVIYSLKLSSGRRIAQRSAKNFTLSHMDSDSCRATQKCYCTSFGACYPQPLPVPIDNCLFMNNLNDPITISYSIINGAGHVKNGTDVTVQPVKSVYGLHEYPGVKVFEGANVTMDSMTLRWIYPISCYQPEGVLIKYGNKEFHVDYPINTHAIDGLEPDSTHKYEIIVKYPENRSPSVALAVTTGGCNDGSLICKGGSSAGSIAGIVIGVLILLLIAVLVVLMFLRWRSNKHPVPDKVREAGNNVFNRLSRRFPDSTATNNVYSGNSNLNNYRKSQGVMLNVAYRGLAGTEEDIYTYGELETDPEASWKHSGDKVEIGDVIASGRFADVKRATLLDKNGRTDMAAKMLRPGASADDILLMKAKMNFLATSVPPHENIVQLVGAVPNESPVILLELCNQTLKDWLKSQGKVDQTVEDNMINFTTHIARGLAHLHDNHITHKRLGVRNILVKSVAGRYIAKITGFGPMKADSAGESDRERIPFKWMAPEQIGVKSGQKRIYNQQTDVWGYGITLWEIFTKGGSPYKDSKLGEMEELHKSGFRLPKPENGPAEMYPDIIMPCWNKKPKSRPKMSEIVSKLNSLYHGGPGDDYVYEEDVNFTPKGNLNKGYGPEELYSDTV